MRIQKVKISCSSNYHTKLFYKSVRETLWNFQLSIPDAFRAAFDFHRCKSNQIRIEMSDARYQKSTSHLMFYLVNQHRITEAEIAYRN